MPKNSFSVIAQKIRAKLSVFPIFSIIAQKSAQSFRSKNCPCTHTTKIDAQNHPKFVDWGCPHISETAYEISLNSLKNQAKTDP